jgi:hypothetical protein
MAMSSASFPISHCSASDASFSDEETVQALAQAFGLTEALSSIYTLPRVKPLWRNGRRGRLKICCSQGRGGSSPSRGTKDFKCLRGDGAANPAAVDSVCVIPVQSPIAAGQGARPGAGPSLFLRFLTTRLPHPEQFSEPA